MSRAYSSNCGCRTPVERVANNMNYHHGNQQYHQIAEEQFSYIKRVGSYLVGRTLGEGSFAKVRLGLHLPTGEKVAIKVLDKHRAANDNYMEMTIRREGRLLRRIRPHPNIVQLYEIMETANSLYLVLELCEGGDFLDLVATRGRLTEPECRLFLRQIIEAVAHLHAFGILHRDLKIENFMLDSARQHIKIIDLGLSTGTSNGPAARTQCGSPAYAAPELIRSPHYGAEVDVWSIGVDMFAMLTGGLPFTVEPFSIKNLYARMMNRDMNPLPSDTSAEAIDLLRRLLEPDPRLRITLQAALEHPWLKMGLGSRKSRQMLGKIVSGVPNKDGVLPDPSVLDLAVATRAAALAGASLGSLLRDVAAAMPSNLAATYHLLARGAKRSENHHHDNDGHSKRCTSALSSDSVTTVTSRASANLKQTNNTSLQRQTLPTANGRFENSHNISNEMEISIITNHAADGNGITNVARVTGGSKTLQRPAKLIGQVQSVNPKFSTNPKPNGVGRPSSLVPSLESNRTHRRNMTPECLNRHPQISTTTSEPASTHTLERRRLRQPQLATAISAKKEEKANNASKSEDGRNTPAQLKNGAVAWRGDAIAGALPECLLTSCCGELPMKLPAHANGVTNGSNGRVASSTPTPPSSMQVSIFAKADEDTTKNSGRRRVASIANGDLVQMAKRLSSPNRNGTKTPPFLTTGDGLAVDDKQMSAAALIVKPAVQAVAAAARRVLCGASPQPGSNINNNNLPFDHPLFINNGNNRTKQAAV